MAANLLYFGGRLDFISKRGYETRTFSNDQLAVINYGSYFGSNHSTNIYSASQDGLSAPIDTIGDFHPNITRCMIHIQTCMIKNGGIISILIMQKGQWIFNSKSLNRHHLCQVCLLNK